MEPDIIGKKPEILETPSSPITDGVEGVPITAPQVIMKNRGLEVIFEEAINYWHTHFPDEVKDFQHDVKFHKDMKFKDTAMTAGGEFMCKGLVPPRLKKAITKMLIMEDVLDELHAPQWLKHPELVNIFFRVFSEGRINETSDLR